MKRFTERFDRRLLSAKDIVMIFSDGWDRGEVDVLEAQMALLKRRANKIIWLNPLLRTRDYRPICQGMRTALPYVDFFLPMGALQDLQLVSRTIEKMIV
ncbi:MAG: VWA domain-containing protein [Desulfobacterales bacterium]